jgi:AraC-like DNA-binding protein
MSNKEINLEEITKRIDIIIYLLIKQRLEKETVTNREIISELVDRGLKDIEIANIFGKSRSYIASEITQMKKPKNKKENK